MLTEGQGERGRRGVVKDSYVTNQCTTERAPMLVQLVAVIASASTVY